MNPAENPQDARLNSVQTRREFLEKSATAAGALTLGTNFAWAAEAPKKKIRLGVVGGNFGRSFYWHKHPDCVVEAVSDLIPERREALMKVYNCTKSYESLEKLILDKNVDAVAVFTGAPDHARHTIMCLNAGKHVVVAVPVAQKLEDCQAVIDAVKRTGLTYLMAETSYWQQSTISARKFYQEGKFGNLFYVESEYMHPGIEVFYFDKQKKPTWRHGSPPMLYPTHCTAHLISVTGERLTEVMCLGWGDNDPLHRGNAYKNPFWNQTALFKTNRGNAMRIANFRRGAVKGVERADYYGDKMSFHFPHPNGAGAQIVRSKGTTTDDAGFIQAGAEIETYDQPRWWESEGLPESLRHESGHEGAHTFITHEFIDALVKNRGPAVDIYEAVAYTAPGIVAHQSSIKGGEQLKIPSFDPT